MLDVFNLGEELTPVLLSAERFTCWYLSVIIIRLPEKAWVLMFLCGGPSAYSVVSTGEECELF